MNHRPNLLRSILLCGLLVLGGPRVSHATNFEDFGKSLGMYEQFERAVYAG